MTPEQLREEATQLERENCDVMKVDQRTQIALLRAHAAALEENAMLAELAPDAERWRYAIAHGWLRGSIEEVDRAMAR